VDDVSLAERHQRNIRALAHRWLGDHAAADEAVQATLIAVLLARLVDFRGARGRGSEGVRRNFAKGSNHRTVTRLRQWLGWG
jgi:hypothetical protein